MRLSAALSVLLLLPPAFAETPAMGVPLPVKVLQMQHEIETVAAPDNTLLAGWTDDIEAQSKDTSGWRCSFSVSADHGKSWSNPVIYKNPDYQLSGNPAVAADAKGNLYSVCMSVTDDDANSKGTLEISRSNDRGAHWSPWKAIVTKDSGYIPDRPKLIASGEGHLDLVFTSLDNAFRKPAVITYLSSFDGGRSWSPERMLSTKAAADSDGDQGAKLMRDHQGRLLVSWGRYNQKTIYFSTSADGIQFSTPVVINTGGQEASSPCTEMAVDDSGSDILISRHTGHAFGPIDLVRSTDGGKTFQVLKPVSANGINEAMTFDRQNKLHLIWTERNGQHLDTLYIHSSDAGASFAAPLSLTGGGYDTVFPADDVFLGGQIGSYQSLLLMPDNSLNAYWIDWRRGNAGLYYSSWKLN